MFKKILSVLICTMMLSCAAFAEDDFGVLTLVENGTVADFDGDGIEEPVAYVAERDEYGDGSFTLTVGDTTFQQDGCVSLNEELYAVRLPWSETSRTLKGTLFIASENGPSDDPVSYFYFYTAGKLYYAGTVEAYADTLTFSGDTFETVVRTDILGTWRRYAKFVLANGWNADDDDYTEIYYVTEVPQDIYAMGIIADTKVDLPLQASRTDATIVGTVPAGSKIAFGATDNLHWVYAESLDGQVRGWFYLDASDYPTQIRVNGTMTDETKVFDNLMYAD